MRVPLLGLAKSIYYTWVHNEQIDFILLFVCSVVAYRQHQNVVRTKKVLHEMQQSGVYLFHLISFFF